MANSTNSLPLSRSPPLLPSSLPPRSVLELWKADLRTINEKAADALADPAKYPNLFPDLEWALQVEGIFLAGRDSHVPANTYPTAKAELEMDLIAMVKAGAAGGKIGLGLGNTAFGLFNAASADLLHLGRLGHAGSIQGPLG